MNKPLVSVVIPNYNYSRYLPVAIQSVIDQTLPDWELIIVDDHSSDDSVAVAQDFISRYPERSIRLIINEQGPQGTSAAVNKGIGVMRGKYFAWLSSDDWFSPSKLERQVALLEEKREYAMTYSLSAEVNDQGEITRLESKISPVDSSWALYHFFKGTVKFPIFSSVLIRRECFETLGLFVEVSPECPEIWRGSDVAMILEIFRQFRAFLIPEYLHFWRVHAANTCFNEIQQNVCRFVLEAFLRKHSAEALFPVGLSNEPSNFPLYRSRQLLRLEMALARDLWDFLLFEIDSMDQEANRQTLVPLFVQYLDKKDQGPKSIKKRFYQWSLQYLPKEICYQKQVIYTLASLYREEGQREQARQFYEEVIEAKNRHARHVVGAAYFHLGNLVEGEPARARYLLEQCLNYIPGHREATRRLLALDGNHRRQTQPGLSLVVTHFNQDFVFPYCLASIQRQRLKPIEIIICDDGSTKPPFACLDQLEREWGVPVFLVWQPDRGFRKGDLLLRAFQMARGDIIATLDGDLMIGPDYLQTMYACLSGELSRWNATGYASGIDGSRVGVASVFSRYEITTPKASGMVVSACGRSFVNIKLIDHFSAAQAQEVLERIFSEIRSGKSPHEATAESTDLFAFIEEGRIRGEVMRKAFQYIAPDNFFSGCLGFWKRDVLPAYEARVQASGGEYRDGAFLATLAEGSFTKRVLPDVSFVFHLGQMALNLGDQRYIETHLNHR